jgi:hypothetical protein
MITVENDWVEYQTVPARRPAVRGGGACAQRVPVARVQSAPAARRAPAVRSGAVARPAKRTAPEPSLRLTRRGRLVLVVLPAILAATCSLIAVGGPLVPAEAAPAASRSVVIGAGDSLWSLAERLAPNADPRDVVAEFERVNGLHDAGVQAGARLVVPAAYASR